ncbi:unnamed protein product [Adineta ricciae]|uniref:Cullin family profile domain-containing protein n=1 Tax=Adineta ricciae TaxID=249248 RepID=A0A816CLB7_ADIRI|nr:unnamed protein product [Adineta ricciae]
MRFNEFVKQNDFDWNYLINSNESFPKYASLFRNDQMKTNNIENAELTIDKVIQRVGYLKDENTFREYYQSHLAERLLSAQSASIDLENYTLSLLKKDFGNFFVSKFDRIYLGHTESSGSDTFILHGGLLKVAFLYSLIEKKKLYLSMLFDYTSDNIMILKYL